MDAIQILAEELLSPAYDGLTDQQAVDALNVETKQVAVPYISGEQVRDLIVFTEFNALTAAQKSTIESLWAGHRIPTASGFSREALLATFGAGTATRAALVASFTKLSSRASELGLPRVKVGHVQMARELNDGK